jgi:hypothetical protein
MEQLLEYDPLVYTAAGIYFLGVVNHYVLMNTIHIILEAPRDVNSMRFKAVMWPYELGLSLWLTFIDRGDE